MEEWRKPEYPEKTPDDEPQKMPHTTARRFKPQARVEPTVLQCRVVLTSLKASVSYRVYP